MPISDELEDLIHQLGSGRIDVYSIAKLREGQLKKRLATFDSVVKHFQDEQARNAIALIEAARQIDEVAFLKTIDYPTVGLYLSAVLKNLLGVGSVSPVLDVGHLGALAAVVAYRAGIDFEIHAVAVGGRVALPGLGAFVIEELSADHQLSEVKIIGRGSKISLRWNDQTFVMPGDPTQHAANWDPIRIVKLVHHNSVAAVMIDDIDPYRHHGGEQFNELPNTVRLTPAQFDTWSAELNYAWQFIVDHLPDSRDVFKCCLQVVTPIDPGENLFTVLRDVNAFGQIFMSFPPNRNWMVALLLDGLQKAQLAALHSLMPLHYGDSDAKSIYVPWSGSPMSVAQLLEGLYAHTIHIPYWNVCRKVSSVRSEQVDASLQFARWQGRIAHICDVVENTCELTTAGYALIGDIRLFANDWWGEVDRDTRQFARCVEADYRACWRLKNLDVNPEFVAKVANAWTSGVPCPSNLRLGVSIKRSGRAGTNNPFDGYKRRELLGIAHIANSDKVHDLSPDQSSADTLLISRKYTEAIDAYKELLVKDPFAMGAFAGLVAACSLNAGISSGLIVRMPEVVHALYCELVLRRGETVDLCELSYWLSSGVSIENSESFDVFE